MYKIFIKNLKLFGYHGVNPDEKINGQDFIFNVAVQLKEYSEKSDIGFNDNISNTVNYSEIIALIKDINSAKRFDLLETLSGHIAQSIMEFFPLVLKVKVTIEKPNPPIRENLKSVGVECKLKKPGTKKLEDVILNDKNTALQEESYAVGTYEDRSFPGINFSNTRIGCRNQKEAGKEVKFSGFYLSAGSNIGDREKNLRDAVAGLESKDFIRIVKISSIYETEPMYYKEQDSFFNIALEGKISGDYSPFEFLGLLKNMEYYMGRKGGQVPYGPRLIDIDLLYFDQLVIASDILSVPHPLIKERKFVLLPLAEIAPGLEIEGKKISDFLKTCKLDEKVVKVKNW